MQAGHGAGRGPSGRERPRDCGLETAHPPEEEAEAGRDAEEDVDGVFDE